MSKILALGDVILS